MRKFDNFCQKYEHWGPRNLMLFVVALSGAVLVLSNLNLDLAAWLAFDREAIAAGQFWRILTFLFVPPTTNLLLGAVALWFYYWVGSQLEREWGRLKFFIFYVTGWAATALFCALTGSGGDATYLNMSLFFAYATLFPDVTILLFFIIPVKVKYLAFAEAALLFAVPLILTPGLYRFLPLIAALNYIIYFYPTWYDFFMSRYGKGARTRKSNVINFKREVKKARTNAATAAGAPGATRRCAVCGITDADAPNTEFRYCSLCARYECYCEKHIFTHEHTTK